MKRITTIVTVIVLALCLCIPAMAVDATAAWNAHAASNDFDLVLTPIAASTPISSLYNGSNYTRDYWKQIGAIGAELDDPNDDDPEPESATWYNILNWN